MTAEEFLRFVAGLFDLDAKVSKERVAVLLDMAGLSGVKTRIGGYSRGMKQRLGVAQALINAPSLLLLDEPTSALDPIGRKDVLEMIGSLKGRTTVFFSTHILADVERVCDTVAILDEGRVVAESGIDELKASHSSHRLVLEVAGDARGLIGDLEKREWVSAASVDGDRIVLAVTDETRAAAEVPAAVGAAGLGLKHLEFEEVSLEDVFMSLVGERR
jgi:ABC-2 type transport system ATP-binding protein